MISNKELCRRFDVIYNNIDSLQAPGLNEYEKSVVFNKAQLEVLKNKLNPKGNKYVEGFDFSSKRQLEFSNLICTKEAGFPFSNDDISSYCTGAWKPQVYSTQTDEQTETPRLVAEDFKMDNVLSIANETVESLTYEETLIFKEYFGSVFKNLFSGTGDGVGILNNFIDWLSEVGIDNSHPFYQKMLKVLEKAKMDLLAGNKPDFNDLWIDLDNMTSREAAISAGLIPETRTVVPVNNVEYDTLSSRPYKYPPKSQAWRMFVNGDIEIVVEPSVQPLWYKMRYIRVPREVELHKPDGQTCELPDFLIDEVLQRAVELAKNSWEGTIETSKAFGERSE